MSDRFSGQRCQDCQGSLVYNKEEKYWQCPYCGKIYEREARLAKLQIDGLARIVNLVKSSLTKLATLDFAGAESDLAKCQSSYPDNVGTMIAEISVPLFKSFFTKERQTEISKVNALLPRFNREFAEITESEEILYDFIDSADLYGLLTVVYSMTGQVRRKELVAEMLNCREITNLNVAKTLINVLLKDKRIEEADILLKKAPPSIARSAVTSVLTHYPSVPRKKAHINNLLNRMPSKADVTKAFDTYFESGKDSGAVMVDVFLCAVTHGVAFNTVKVINSVLQNCTTPESAKAVFDIMGESRVDVVTAKVILQWASIKCPDTEISKIGFKYLFGSNSLFEISDVEITELFGSAQSDDVKCRKLVQMLDTFKITGKSMDKLLAYHILQNRGTPEFRRTVYGELVKRVVSIQQSVIDTYLLKTTIDAENKADFLRSAFEKTRTASSAVSTFSEYLTTKIDAPATRVRVISVFLDFGVVPSPDALEFYLLNSAEEHTDALLDKLIARSCKVKSSTFDRYIGTLRNPDRYNLKIAELMTRVDYRLSLNNFRKYIFQITEPGRNKVIHTLKYMTACTEPVERFEFSFEVAGMDVMGNIAQAYFLLGKDPEPVKLEILEIFKQQKIKLDPPVEIISDRKKLKLKKFIELNASELGETIQKLADELL